MRPVNRLPPAAGSSSSRAVVDPPHFLAAPAHSTRKQVSDIKRSNGLLSDTAMFAREYIRIPTGQLPIGCVAVRVERERLVVGSRERTRLQQQSARSSFN